MTEIELAKLRIAHSAYIAKCQDRGDNIVTFSPACCGAPMQTLAPKSAHEIWDTLSTCPSCGEMFYKVVIRDGATGTLPQ